MSKLVLVTQKSLLVTLSFLLSLLVMELALRYTDKVRTYSDIINLKGTPYIASYSPYLPFTLPEGVSFPHRTSEYDVVYDINGHGYRGEFPRSIQKATGTKRILIIGDSFTLGWGNALENTFVQRVQLCLNTKEYSVINAAYHAGYSPDSYYAYLVREGVELKPDIVIVALYTGNDVTDMLDNQWLETDESGAPTKLLTSRLYMDYAGNIIHPPERIDTLLPWNYKVPTLRNSYAFIAVTQLFNGVLNISNSFGNPLLEKELTIEEAWARLAIVLKSIGEWSKENDSKLIYVTIPLVPRRGQRDYPHEKVANMIAKKFNFPLVDIRPHLSEQAYFDQDGHLNKLGNTITSNIIIEYLSRNVLVSVLQKCTG